MAERKKALKAPKIPRISRKEFEALMKEGARLRRIISREFDSIRILSTDDWRLLLGSA